MHNQRNRRAAAPKPAKGAAATAADTAPAFPLDVAIPPHRGAVARAVAVPTPPAPPLAVLFAVPPPGKPKAPARKRRPAAMRRRAARKAKSRGKLPPRGPRLAAPVVTLPKQAESLVLVPAKGRALVIHRADGWLDQMAEWIGRRALILWRRLGGLPTTRPAPRRARLSPEAEELRHLRAENARLKRQMEALLAMREGTKSAPATTLA